MIINFKPQTQDDTALLDDLLPEAQKIVLNWVTDNIRPRKIPLNCASSYCIKHILESDTGIYITNNQFKDAMLQCDYEPVNEHKRNWYYCISRRSPAFSSSRFKPRALHRPEIT